jgi:hypothetical protein
LSPTLGTDLNRRRRIIGNAIGVITVLTALASTLFALYPTNAVANCYVATPLLPGVIALGVGFGLIALAGWVYLLRDRVEFGAQIGACAAMGVVIFVLLIAPALFFSGHYGTSPMSDRWPCNLGGLHVLLVAASVFTPLVAAAVSYGIARALPGHWSLRWSAVGGFGVWCIYVVAMYAR